MGMKNIWYTEKGRIGIVVLSTTIITTIILIPILVLINNSIHKNEKYIQSYGYDCTVTSTAARQNEWMGIDGDSLNEEELTLGKNSNYHSVDFSDQIIDGVKKTKGISYLSNASISTNDNFIPLDISNSYDEKGIPIWITPQDEEYIHAPLNMTMKIPVGISNVLRNHLVNNKPTKLTIDELNNGTPGYGDWIENRQYKKDFSISFVLFNYVSYSKNAGLALNEKNIFPVNDQIENGVSSKVFSTWIEETFPEDVWGIFDGTENLIIDGTGTDEYAVDVVINAFNKDNKANKLGLKIVQNLNNIGSYGAWETTSNDPLLLAPGVTYNFDEYDKKNNGTPNAFIGTSSRGIMPHQGEGTTPNEGEISYWGYNEDIYYEKYGNEDPNDVIYNLNDFTSKDAIELPLATTIASDSIVFFIDKDTKVINPITNKEETPSGITKDGVKAIYEYGETWENLAKLKEIKF